jgi:hypothetical protein
MCKIPGVEDGYYLRSSGNSYTGLMRITTRAFASACSTLRTIALWVVLIVNAVAAGFCLWSVIRVYGVSTVGSDGRLSTPWENGLAPYLLVLFAGVLISAIWSAVGRRLARQLLMLCTVIYLAFFYYGMIHLMLVRDPIPGHSTQVILLDVSFFVISGSWLLLSYWCLIGSTPLAIHSLSNKKPAS